MAGQGRQSDGAHVRLYISFLNMFQFLLMFMGQQE